jgi:glucose uptake protein
MLGTLYAIITVLAWGTWLAPAQGIPLAHQQVKTFYVAGANLILAFVVALVLGFGPITWNVFWLPFIGGLIWSVSGVCAFTAADKLGMAKAFSLWAPLNIIVSLICGRLLFGEFVKLDSARLLILFLAVAVIIAGVLLIVFAREAAPGREANLKAARLGWFGALGAGLLWGVYFIPIKLSGVSLWIAAFPMALGIFAGSSLLLLLAGPSLRLGRTVDYLKIGATGVLWTVGNYGMLLLVDHLGAGKGFTIAQLAVVINALVGIYWLHDPPPRSRSARMTLAGCVLATLGGILLGNLK